MMSKGMDMMKQGKDKMKKDRMKKGKMMGHM